MKIAVIEIYNCHLETFAAYLNLLKYVPDLTIHIFLRTNPSLLTKEKWPAFFKLIYAGYKDRFTFYDLEEFDGIESFDKIIFNTNDVWIDDFIHRFLTDKKNKSILLSNKTIGLRHVNAAGELIVSKSIDVLPTSHNMRKFLGLKFLFPYPKIELNHFPLHPFSIAIVGNPERINPEIFSLNAPLKLFTKTNLDNMFFKNNVTVFKSESADTMVDKLVKDVSYIIIDSSFADRVSGAVNVSISLNIPMLIRRSYREVLSLPENICIEFESISTLKEMIENKQSIVYCKETYSKIKKLLLDYREHEILRVNNILLSQFNKKHRIKKSYLPRNDIPVENPYEILSETVEDANQYHIALYYLDDHRVKIIARSTDTILWNENIHIKLHSLIDDGSEIICIGPNLDRNKDHLESEYSTAIKLNKVNLHYNQLIPKRIVQTNNHRELDALIYNSVMTFIELNPEYEYEFFDAADRRKFIKDHFDSRVLNAYDSLVPGAYKVDLFRYCYLYIRGGCYFDGKHILKIPLRKWVDKTAEIQLCQDMSKNAYNNAVILATPKSNHLKEVINECVKRIEDYEIHQDKSFLYMTGPELLYSVCKEIQPTIIIKNTGKYETDNYFYNIATEDQLIRCYNKLYYVNYQNIHGSLHHWAHLWILKQVIYQHKKTKGDYITFIYPHDSSEKFYIDVRHNVLFTQRIDMPLAGWGLNLVVKVVHELSNAESLIVVGPSDTNVKIIPLGSDSNLISSIDVDHSDVEMIKQSGLFNEEYYRNQTSEIIADPISHYLTVGHKFGMNPNNFFDSEFYIKNYPQVVSAEIPSFCHYLRYGMDEGNMPNAVFLKDRITCLKHMPHLSITRLNSIYYQIGCGNYRTETTQESPLASKVFTDIYSKNTWGFGSGAGSLPGYIIPYIKFLEDFLKRKKIKTILDIGCGDWQFSNLIDWSDYHYTGIDCVATLIESNNKNHGKENIQFFLRDIITEIDKLTGNWDLILLKDVAIHWPNEIVNLLIPKLKQKAKYLLLTNTSTNTKDNEDGPLGGYRALSYRMKPLSNFGFKLLYTFGEKSHEKEILLLNRWEPAKHVIKRSLRHLKHEASLYLVRENKNVAMVILLKGLRRIYRTLRWASSSHAKNGQNEIKKAG